MKESYIVTVDDRYGNFEIVDWCQTKDEAEVKFAEYSLEDEYPDKEGLHLRLFQEIKSTDSQRNTVQGGLHMTEEQNRNWKNNLLLYLETCMVDHGGLFRWNKIGDDEVFLDEYQEEGLINYKRLPFKEIEKNRYNLGPAGPFTHRLTDFTEEAWVKATELRRARAARLAANPGP